MLGILLAVLLVLLLVGGLPAWGYHQYGYGPSGILGVVLIVVLILLVMGRI